MTLDPRKVLNPISKFTELCVKPWQNVICSQEMYTCKNSKPQGPEKRFILDPLDLMRTSPSWTRAA